MRVLLYLNPDSHEEKMEQITSRDNERVKQACRLAKDADLRREEGLFFAEGRRLCADLSASQRPVCAFLTQKALEEDPVPAELAETAFLVSGPVADKLSQTKNTQGVFCLFRLPAAAEGDLNPTKGILLCEELQDPANVGAVIRSAAAFGFGGVAFSTGSADPFSPRALRASAGAVLRVPVLAGVDFAGVARGLKDKGAALYAAALGEGARPVAEFAGRGLGAFGLMVGNEGAGLTQEALHLADHRVIIPMQNEVESLNAAVAVSVLLYAFSLGGSN